ncbi:hypothetical protein [Halobacterium salinarum]|uniref:hypothetical protein n=1 Tax=Halobacterium salinarum TaxID=2242 RepID=UPI001F34F89C|nr:hypothetical protein [Halobacterium salinarum]MCF2165392.1 hypothetical protein [Halobacterium salinarum]MCF2168252.1 hypothetical protein [Halobacterium salinarum]
MAETESPQEEGQTIYRHFTRKFAPFSCVFGSILGAAAFGFTNSFSVAIQSALLGTIVMFLAMFAIGLSVYSSRAGVPQ